MTLKDTVRAVLSDGNRHFTRENLGLDREPTPDELLSNFEKHNTIMTVQPFTVVEESAGQYPLFVGGTP